MGKNLKTILFVQSSAIFPWKVGGAEVFDYYLIRSLQDKVNIQYASTEQWNDIDIKWYKLPKLKPLGFFIPIGIFYHILCNQDRIDMIHIRYSRSKWLNWWPYLVCELFFNIPYTITIHGGGLKAWGFKSFYKALFKNAKYIWGVSDRICEEYEARTGKKVHKVLPLIPFKSSNGTSNNFVHNYSAVNLFLIVGSLKQIKNPQTVVSAFSHLGKAFLRKNKIKVLFAGDGRLREKLERSISDDGLSEFIHLLGIVNRNDIPKLYSISKYFIISSNFEGTPIALLEAMFNKLAIIGSNVPGIKNIISNEKNGLLYELHNHKELAEKIKYYIENQNTAINFGLKAYNDYLAHYNYAQTLAAYQKVFEGSNA